MEPWEAGPPESSIVCDTLKSFSLGLGDDIHHFSVLEVIDRQNIFAFEIVFALKPDFHELAEPLRQLSRHARICLLCWETSLEDYPI